MRFLAFLCLLLSVFGLTDVAQANDKPFPTDRLQMERFMAFNMARGDQTVLQTIREDMPEFSYVQTPIRTYEPIFGANKTVDLIAYDTDDAVAALHDPETGETLFACQLPCRAKVNDQSDYVISMLSLGRVPYISWLGSDHPHGELYGSYLGADMIENAGKAGDCWMDHKRAGLPDTKATACVQMPGRMPPHATRSGHCLLQFDVLPTGWVTNIQAVSCTEPMFESPALDALRWWYFVPQTQRGQTVIATAIRAKMSFRLTDEAGRLIDESGIVQR